MNLSTVERDIRAWKLAREYLLKLAPQEVTEGVLSHYLSPRADLPSNLRDIYLRLLESAQNRGMMATVIGGSIGGLEALRPVLCNFEPSAVLGAFESPEAVLDAIETHLHPRGQFRRDTGSLWPLFARAVISGARFLSLFADAKEFYGWARTFADDARSRGALPFLLSREVEGLGFALACGFLMELGFVWYAKPDVHVTAIAKGLELCTQRADDYDVLQTIVRVARNCGTTAYAVDKTFWLVGSGFFYDHKHFGHEGHVRIDREQFIRDASAALNSAT